MLPDRLSSRAAQAAQPPHALQPDILSAQPTHTVAPREGRTLFHAPERQGVLSGRRALLASALIAVVVLVAIALVGYLAQGHANATDFTARLLAPSLEHPFGTDWMGRDMFARIMAGLATSLGVGALAAAASSVVALVLALASALGGSRADTVVSWLVDLIMGVPHLVLLLLVSYALGRGATGVMVGIALTHWPSLTRVLRAEMLQTLEEPYLRSLPALGVPGWRIAVFHLLPHVLPQYVVGLILLFPHAILHEASITFLGFGLSPEQPAIGVILSEAMGYLTAGAWWLAVIPGVALLVVVLLFDRIGSCVRRLIAPEGVQL